VSEIRNPITYVLIGGRATPGIAELRDVQTSWKFEDAKGRGVSGTADTYVGKEAKPFKIVIRFYTDDELEEWRAYAREVLDTPPEGDGGKAKDVWHPQLEDRGIRAATVRSVTAPRPVGTKGVFEVIAEMKPWEPRKPGSGKVTGAKDNARKGVIDDPVDAYIRELTGQVQELAQ